jgi:curved DNA-binding protein CbpA
VLGVGPDADEAAVRRAYRERAKETHPDTDGGEEDEFKRVNRAYERLTD